MPDNKPDNYLEMSDEDFIKIPNAPEVTEVDKAQEITPEPVTPVEADTKTEEEKQEEINPVDKTEDNPEDTKSEDEDKLKEKTEEKSSENNPEAKAEEWKEYEEDKSKTPEENKELKDAHDASKPKPVEPDKTKEGEPEKKTDTPVDQAKTITGDEFMAAVMKPLKANGKEIKINTPDEALRLMQMGAGFAKKMQQIQPALKTVRLLEKHDLVDPSKLSFLIDLQEGNKDAIRKLLKDKGIDPLDLNTTDDVTYRPINRAVSDSELSFHDALTDLQSHPQGKETIREINETWDQTSKQAIFDKPELLKVIQDQKDTGIYTQITSEIDRQKLLGHIPANTPFLKSYKIAGDFLVANNQLQAPSDTTAKPAVPVAQVQPQPVVLATRTEPVKTTVANTDKAKAAAGPTSPSAKKAAVAVNYLEMPDDQFMKQFEGRL